MDSNDEFDPQMIEKLKVLIADTYRDPEKVASGRAAFLKESARISQNVSAEEIRRHKNWKKENQSQFMLRRKEGIPMLSTITSIIIAISILLGGSGITLAAAQASLPNDVLYNIKLLSENALMDLTANPEGQLDLALDLVDRRANEIQELLLTGESPTEEIQTRYRDQIELAFILALTLPQDNVIQAFEKIQTRLQTQQEMFTLTKTDGSENSIMALTQTRLMIQERLQILENDQGNMLQIMEQQQLQQQIGTPSQQNGSQPNYGTQSPSDAVNGNPWTTGTPTPGTGYGPGASNNPFTNNTTTPGAGDRPGESQNPSPMNTLTPDNSFETSEGDNPWTTGTPTPGSGYGPGDGTGDCLTCTPKNSDNDHGGNTQETSTPQNGPNGGNGNH